MLYRHCLYSVGKGKMILRSCNGTFQRAVATGGNTTDKGPTKGGEKPPVKDSTLETVEKAQADIPNLSRMQTQKPAKSFEEIPGPKPLPIVGNLWRYLPGIGEYSFDKLHKSYAKLNKQYGPLVREKMFGDRLIVHVFDHDDMMTVYAKNEPHRKSHRALGKYRTARPHLYSGPGLFPSNGPEWLRFRKLFQPVLLDGSITDVVSDDLEDITDEMIARIPSALNKKKEMDLQDFLFNWALECTGAITLNKRLGCLSVEGNKEATSLVKAANDTHYAVYRTETLPKIIAMIMGSERSLEASQDLVANVLLKYFDEAKQRIKEGNNPNSVLARMFQIPEASEKDIFTMIMDMFMAGIDTSAFTLSFALYNLAKNRDVQQKLREELRKELPTKESRMTKTKSRLRYMKSTVHESLRVNPISIGNGRVLQNDMVLSGYFVPAQTMVILHHQVAAMSDQYFTSPEKFDPERWMRREASISVSSPFGAGARMCAGRHFALLELHLGVTKMVLNYDISYHHADIDCKNRLINVLNRPLRLRLEKLDY